MSDGVAQARGSFWSSLASLFASSGTLVCCAIPAVLVTVGAGAGLSTLVALFPQIVWLSEHKVGLFAFAGVALLASGCLQWRHRGAACPIDPRLRDACLRTRKVSRRLYVASLASYLVGGFFAFGLPWLSG